jgi:hypothetical protein
LRTASPGRSCAHKTCPTTSSLTAHSLVGDTLQFAGWCHSMWPCDAATMQCRAMCLAGAHVGGVWLCVSCRNVFCHLHVARVAGCGCVAAAAMVPVLQGEQSRMNVRVLLPCICAGNRPSTSLLLPELSAYTVGQLLALYEHQVAVQVREGGPVGLSVDQTTLVEQCWHPCKVGSLVQPHERWVSESQAAASYTCVAQYVP